EGLPGRSQQRTRTTTLALWTSMPAQRGVEGIHEVLRANLFAEDLEKQTVCYACSPQERGQQFRVRDEIQARLCCRPRRQQAKRRPSSAEEAVRASVAGPQPIFMVSGCRSAA